ncbi:hypothetical protein EVAR_99590_1 [Eumeta japonica]|uniref:Uncharacterized protein n=1 Tax=Eumeta variegata TaxID=151549 RepID=A0A4C1ZM58_EUMVA|nr:hypothetical protein EVAR_99590_1 [Eumeta japonica]
MRDRKHHIIQGTGHTNLTVDYFAIIRMLFSMATIDLFIKNRCWHALRFLVSSVTNFKTAFSHIYSRIRSKVIGRFRIGIITGGVPNVVENTNSLYVASASCCTAVGELTGYVSTKERKAPACDRCCKRELANDLLEIYLIKDVKPLVSDGVIASTITTVIRTQPLLDQHNRLIADEEGLSNNESELDVSARDSLPPSALTTWSESWAIVRPKTIYRGNIDRRLKSSSERPMAETESELY